MSLQYAKGLVKLLLTSSSEKKELQYTKLLELLDSGEFFELTDKEIRKATGLKQELITNIKHAIDNDPHSNWKRDIVLFKTKHGTVSLMNIGRRRRANLEIFLTLNSASEENHV